VGTLVWGGTPLLMLTMEPVKRCPILLLGACLAWGIDVLIIHDKLIPDTIYQIRSLLCDPVIAMASKPSKKSISSRVSSSDYSRLRRPLDSQTNSHLNAELYDLARTCGLPFSQAALRAVRTILENSKEVPAARLKEAEKAMHTLLKAAEESRDTRLNPWKKGRLITSRFTRPNASRNTWRYRYELRLSIARIRPADVYAGLKSICPLWPFC